MSLFSSVVVIVLGGIPFAVVTFLNEYKPNPVWMSVLTLGFALFGYVSGSLVMQITIGIFVWHVIYCVFTSDDWKFGTYSRTALWYLGIFCTAYTAAYFFRNGIGSGW